MFPGQNDSVRNAVAHAREQGEHRATRRDLILAFLCAPVVATGGYFIGWRARGVEQPGRVLSEPSERLAWLHTIARGPLAELEARQAHLVTAVEQGTLDDTLAYGVQRLIVLAMSRPDNQVLHARLGQLSRNEQLPLHLKASLALLAERRGK